MRQVRITNTDDLIQFINNTDLSMNDYRNIIDKYSGTKFFLMYKAGHNQFTKEDKENLIILIKKNRDNIEDGFPMFFVLGSKENKL